MQPHEIAKSYDAIATRWLEPHLASNGIRQHEHALKFRQGGGAAIDVGSGCNGRFARLLLEQGYEVECLDLSAEMLALAKERVTEATYLQTDVCEWVPGKSYDFITAWDSIWHVPLTECENVLRKLCGALAPGGVFISTTGGVDRPEEKHDSSMGVPVSYSALGVPGTLRVIADAGCVCRHLEYDQLPESHVWFVAQKPLD